MSGPLDDITIPTNPPPELKSRCADFLKRAAETRKAEPVISYWCTLAAAESALELKDRSSEGTKFLLSLMDTLEAMKAALADNEAVTSAAAGAAYVENFALRVFMNADNMDRAGKWDKGRGRPAYLSIRRHTQVALLAWTLLSLRADARSVIRAFLAASHFFGVLKSCNGGVLLEEYARWKAADLAKALREGREPVHGPPVPEEPLVDPDLPSAPIDAADAAALGLPSVPSEGSPGRRANAPPSVEIPQDTSDTGNWSTVATPGVDGPESSLPSIPSHSPSGSLSTPVVSPPVPPKDLPSPPSMNTRKASAGSTGSTGSGDAGTPKPSSPRTSSPKTSPKKDAKPRSSSMSRSQSGGSEREKKNVRFMGPDGAPLSPGGEMDGDEKRFDEPSAPPPSEVGAAPAATAPPQSPPTPTSARSPVRSPAKSPVSSPQAPPPAIPGALASMPPPFNGMPAPSSLPGIGAAPSLAAAGALGGTGVLGGSYTPPPTHPAPSTHTHAPAPAPPAPSAPTAPAPISAPILAPAPVQAYSTGPPRKLNRKETEQVQKHARWAISALEFDDPETAKKELIKALEMLG
ncbi:late endosome to vacuole transport-related protein [Trichosporon asahii var. asahii CBS 2479]|uniref:Late endosome to vacuole transport-related protein n=1 Tax=Trichosporon asahii var. asahii (strain ATCC 90039 / CBS 2479 / JCM 2466 / KCTC 7840 / NBRC 103889/ NCYC 2677 / UAMH 7654) TaxID=1186058 RepID=J5TQ49_TRIAS|nr:late endosome to vacuole transport-related protein [Trichosporon asahii var. asahii CBS 2479]EJT52086.1 late endosome to vacuole transport-related protein [Trichosporon asahii var. asahii CBS 2479]